MRATKLFLCLTGIVLFLLSGCHGGKTSFTPPADARVLNNDARLFMLADCGDFLYLEIKNPWDTTQLLGKFALVDRDSIVPASIDGTDVTVIRTPVESSLVYSSVHAGAIKEIGAIDAITGVADAEYFKIPEITDGIACGRIINIGNSMNPAVERVVELSPEIIVVSPFQNAGHGAIESIGTPIVEFADYMESTPLGRAEWIKVIGALYGHYDEAASIYDATAARYNALKEKVAHVDKRPKIISEQVIDGIWALPGGKSYMARIFKDAATDYPWSDDNSAGSLQLDITAVLDKAHDADLWLIRAFGHLTSLDALRRDNKLNAEFAAFKNGGVYCCDTEASNYYEEFPFHPDLLLEELIKLAHPELYPDSLELRYYEKVK